MDEGVQLRRADVGDATADVAALPPAEFAFPGPLRDRLVAAILDGTKTSTTSLVAEHEHEGEPLPAVGDRSALLDSAGARVAVLEVTGVRVAALADVDLDHARDEGEGHEDVAAWRADHERFFHSPEMRAALGDAGFTTDDATRVVLERFAVVELGPRTAPVPVVVRPCWVTRSGSTGARNGPRRCLRQGPRARPRRPARPHARSAPTRADAGLRRRVRTRAGQDPARRSDTPSCDHCWCGVSHPGAGS